MIGDMSNVLQPNVSNKRVAFYLIKRAIVSVSDVTLQCRPKLENAMSNRTEKTIV
jgi:hypothetical protein